MAAGGGSVMRVRAGTLSGMLGVLTLAWSGVMHPRPVAARVIARDPGFKGAALMVVFSYSVDAFFSAAVPGVRGPESAANPLGLHLQSFALHFLLFVVTTGIASWLGRAVGGHGDAQRVAVAVGWAFVLQAMFAPLVAMALSTVTPESVPAGALLVLFATGVIGLWLMASCIAEAHGFKSTFAVAAVLFGFSIAFGMIAGMVILMSAFGGS